MYFGTKYPFVWKKPNVTILLTRSQKEKNDPSNILKQKAWISFQSTTINKIKYVDLAIIWQIYAIDVGPSVHMFKN